MDKHTVSWIGRHSTLVISFLWNSINFITLKFGPKAYIEGYKTKNS